MSQSQAGFWSSEVERERHTAPAQFSAEDILKLYSTLTSPLHPLDPAVVHKLFGTPTWVDDAPKQTEAQKPSAANPATGTTDVQNPTERKPSAANPAIGTTDVQNPTERKPSAANPATGTTDVQNPTERKPSAANPATGTTDVQNPTEPKPEARKPSETEAQKQTDSKRTVIKSKDGVETTIEFEKGTNTVLAYKIVDSHHNLMEEAVKSKDGWKILHYGPDGSHDVKGVDNWKVDFDDKGTIHRRDKRGIDHQIETSTNARLRVDPEGRLLADWENHGKVRIEFEYKGTEREPAAFTVSDAGRHTIARGTKGDRGWILTHAQKPM